MAKIVVHTDQSKNKSARNSFIKGSFYSNADMSQIPLPTLLKFNIDILQLIVKGENLAVIEIIKKQKLREIVGIRGLSMQIEDLEFEDEPVETIMWNPLHFAVYY